MIIDAVNAAASIVLSVRANMAPSLRSTPQANHGPSDLANEPDAPPKSARDGESPHFTPPHVRSQRRQSATVLEWWYIAISMELPSTKARFLGSSLSSRRSPVAAVAVSLLLPTSLGCSSSGSSNAGPTGDTGGASSTSGATGDATTAGHTGGASMGTATEGGAGGVIPGSVRWVGRVDLTDPAAPRFAWSGTGFVANVSGPTISVKLKSEKAGGFAVYFQPVIDGTPGDRFSVSSSDKTVTLATGLADGDHKVEVYRETEGRYGDNVFEGFPDGAPKDPPPASDRLIEIDGDSISAGYGNLGMEQHPNSGADPNGGCTYSTETQSAYMTYGAIAARTLGAEASIIAISGIGVYRDNLNSMTNVLPMAYSDTLGYQPMPTWSFDRQPQVVVINLGTNDFAMGDPGMTEFQTAYTAFLTTIRGKYPDAVIFCAIGPLLFGDGLVNATKYITAVVANANANGDSKVQVLDFGQQDATKGTGCDYHPNVAEHMVMADTLVAAVRAAVGW
jgi:hypothetical protein